MFELILEHVTDPLNGVPGGPSSLALACSGEWARLNEVDEATAAGGMIELSDGECLMDKLDLKDAEGPRAR
jgi:hypothetical protein